MVSKISRKSRDKSSYANYFKKAKQFGETMDKCFNDRNYDAAALNGIHAIISGIDAVLVFRHGIVSSSQNHEDAVKLLIELIPEGKTQAKHALAVIRRKTVVEYMDTLCSESDVLEIMKHTERFLAWVKTKLPD
ncbi:MAG: HEPN domain-containing protein [Elusimicrobiota bacterium]